MDLCVDARVVFDTVSASDICDLAESSLKLHLISVRDRMVQGIIRFLYWVDTRDMLADGLTRGGIDRALLDAVCEHCRYECKHEPLRHSKSALADDRSVPKQKFIPAFRSRSVRLVNGNLRIR